MALLRHGCLGVILSLVSLSSSQAFSPLGTHPVVQSCPNPTSVVTRFATAHNANPTVDKANGWLAEFAIFSVEPDQQAQVVETTIATMESTLKRAPGFVSGTVLRSNDGLRVTSYIQWENADVYVATTSPTGGDVHLFEIFAQEPPDSVLTLWADLKGLINFGIFKMKQPSHQTRFVELFRQALVMVSGQEGLVSTHAHRSLDGWRCINFGHWRSLDDFTAMDTNRPFSPLFGEMLDLADNEYQKTLHQVVYTTTQSK